MSSSANTHDSFLEDAGAYVLRALTEGEHEAFEAHLRGCRHCRAYLDLLVEYVSQLQTGLERAESLTRAGELDQAVWAYLAVLEVDPDNATARRQVGRVVTAVRQFDRVRSHTAKVSAKSSSGWLCAYQSRRCWT